MNKVKEKSAKTPTLIEIPIDKVSPWKDNPRRSPGEEEIGELAASFLDVGPIQPIVVRPMDGAAGEAVNPKAEYLLVCGERRYRAAAVAMLETLPAIVRDVTREQALKIAIIENLQREDVNPIDEARGLNMLLKETDLTQEAVGEKIGKSQAYIANRVRLLDLPAAVVNAIAAGTLTASHGKVLLKLKRWPAVVEAVAKRAIKDQNSVAELESDLENGCWQFFHYLPNELYREIRSNGPSGKCADSACHDIHDGRCMNPGCYDGHMQKLAEAQRKEDKALLKKLQAEGKKVKSIPDVRNMSRDSYEQIQYSQNPKLADCETAKCEHLIVARGYGDKHEPICINPKCFKKQQRAATVDFNKRVKQERADLITKIAQSVGELDDMPNHILLSLLREKLEAGYNQGDKINRAKEFAGAFGIAIDKKGDVSEQLREALNNIPFERIAQMLVYFWILDQEHTHDYESRSWKRDDAHQADKLLGRPLRKFKN